MHVSHVSEDDRFESVIDHLREVADMATEFAQPFGAGGWAYAAGLMHDVGKYSGQFQNRILHDGPRCDHSTAGAYQLFDACDAKLLAYCVAGHHGGLPDGGSRFDVSDESTLWARMIKAREGRLPDYRAFSSEVAIPTIGWLAFSSTVSQDNFSLSFLTRMIFSCLVDADFLCTERFMHGEGRVQLSSDSPEVLLGKLESKLKTFYPPSTELNKVRCSLLDACAQAAIENPGIFSLTVPTGGGKTFASMRFALQHACSGDHGMRRVIYVAPYTSIIEQNAAVFREVLGERSVLEHHANFDFEDLGENGELLRLAAENWDAPVVVTTNVQLFESLYSNKTSRCRKLHNIANSVLVLDEAQMIPTTQLKPCVRALAELVHRYGCTVVLCTATQPSLTSLFEEYGCPVREIAPDPQGLYEHLKRVTYRYEGELEDGSLARQLLDCNQVLCVVNSRKQARHLYDLVASACMASAEVADAEGAGVYHLSTLMYPVHRQRTLDKVRQRLKAGEPCRVVATSLIEAGVDVDFPVVFRALAGVDSIVQCAGRCNREGRYTADESVVRVFRPSEPYRLPSDVEQKAALAWSVFSQGNGARADPGRGVLIDESFDFGALDTIESYFSQLHAIRGDNLDAAHVLRDLTEFPCDNSKGTRVPLIPFKSSADRFRMIEEGSRPVVIPDDAIEFDLRQLREGYLTRGTMRRISRYTVGLYDNDIRALKGSGALELLNGDTYVLCDRGLYRDTVGLDVADAGGKGLFMRCVQMAEPRN